MAYHSYSMDYIEDKDVYKAVMFACQLLKQGKSYTSAIGISSNYYDVNPEEVRHYVSQRSGRKQANIDEWKKKRNKRSEENNGK